MTVHKRAVFLLSALVGCPTPAIGQLPTELPAVAGPTQLDSANDQFFASSDARIRYRDFGRGEPVLLIHGYAGSLNWPQLADSLAVDHRVIVFDVRGFGQSTKFDQPQKFGGNMADDAVRLLDHLQIDRAHVVGHSMGALVAANLTQRHPTRVLTLTLVAGPLWRDSLAAERAIASWVAGLEHGERLKPILTDLNPALSDSAVTAASNRMMSSNDSSSLVAVLKSFPGLIPKPQLTIADVPTLAIVGSGDPLLPLTRGLTEVWPQVRIVEVEGAGHASILTHPVFLSEVRALLRSRQRQRKGLPGKAAPPKSNKVIGPPTSAGVTVHGHLSRRGRRISAGDLRRITCRVRSVPTLRHAGADDTCWKP